ncbi:hypothetical protein [Achromobacter sp. NFACC18-2]|uniref:hypothetical protein n=1 Tax=Achromobacter sp. NFACC18-2 TaxID=1564112 RepID=UPI000B819140|nr:hypothetical protein [Achromobacter sp. NFACC18-2]
MKNELSIAFIGKGGNRGIGDAPARRAAGRPGRVCAANDRHVIDINQDARGAWTAAGRPVAAACGSALARSRARRFAVTARNIEDGVACARQSRQDDTLAVRVAAWTALAGGAGK